MRLPETTVPPPPGGWLGKLFRWRFVLLGLYVAGAAALTYALVTRTPLQLEIWAPPGQIVVGAVLYFAVQAAFLAGAPHLRWPRPAGRRSMRASMLSAALMMALLSAGMVGLGVSLFHGEGTLNNLDKSVPAWHESQPVDVPWPLVLLLLVAWAGWSFVFVALWAGEWRGKFSRVYRLLIAGSVLELLVTIPVDAAVRKRTKCYCSEGSYLALVVSILTLFWTFGPGLVMLFLARRMQRRADLSCCLKCGYDLRASKERCPECGTPIPAQI